MSFPSDIVRLVRSLLWKSRVIANNTTYHLNYELYEDKYENNIVRQALLYIPGQKLSNYRIIDEHLFRQTNKLTSFSMSYFTLPVNY